MRALTVCLTLLDCRTLAFVPSFPTKTSRLTKTQLEVARRDVLAGIVGGWLASAALMSPAAEAASSTTFFEPEKLSEPAQMSQGGKLDLNSAFVVSSCGVRSDVSKYRKWEL